MCECPASGKHWHTEALIADDDTLIFFKFIRPPPGYTAQAGAGLQEIGYICALDGLKKLVGRRGYMKQQKSTFSVLNEWSIKLVKSEIRSNSNK